MTRERKWKVTLKSGEVVEIVTTIFSPLDRDIREQILKRLELAGYDPKEMADWEWATP